MLALLIAIFGHPLTALRLTLNTALASLCPCPPAHAAQCEAVHARVVVAVATVASEQRHPYDAAARLLAACAHETGCRVEHQVRGPGVTIFSIEAPIAERAALLADDVLAARTALARTGYGFRMYACGKEHCDEAHEKSAEELRKAYRAAVMAIDRAR